MRHRDLLPLAALVVAAAILRFATIDVQSYWHDETLTVDLLRKSFGGMISALPRYELTPPLYYLLAWPWTRVFGSLEVGLRSLSAVAGIATVPVAYLAGRELVSRRAGIALAALTAFNPLLVWYSQEARPYSLLVLVGALSFLFFVRALRRRSDRELALWALASILALLTHYFAAFLVVPEGLWLAWVWRPRTRAVIAGAAVAAAGAALIPLAVREKHYISSDYIQVVGLRRRLIGVPEDFLTGFVVKWDTGREKLLDGLALAIGAVGVWFAFARTDESERRGVLLAAAAAIIAAGVPALLAIAGVDFLDTRNILVAWLPAALVVAAGFAARRNGRAAAVGGVAALCALGVAATAVTQADPIFHRSDFRGGARALGPARGARVLALPVVIGPIDYGVYLGRLDPLPSAGAVVSELDAVLPFNSRIDRPRPTALGPPPPGFRLVERRYTDSYTLVRWRAARPARVTQAQIAATLRPLVPLASLVIQR